MTHFFAWTIPLSLVACYVMGAFYLRKVARERAERRGKAEGREPLMLLLLGAPSVWLILLVAGGLLAVLLPLPPHQAGLLIDLLRIALLIAIIIVGRELLFYASDHAAPDSMLRHALVRNAISGTLVGLCLLMILGVVGVPILPIIVLGGVLLGVAAVGAREGLGNLLAGVYLHLRRPIELGDFIEIETGEAGQVKEIDWSNTAIQTTRGVLTIIPNSRIMGSVVRNFGGPATPAPFELKIAIASEVTLERATKSTQQALETVVLEQPKLVASGEKGQIIFDAISGSGTELRIVLAARDYAAIEPLRHALIIALHKRYKADRIALKGEDLAAK